MTTREQAIDQAAQVIAQARASQAERTVEEAARAAYTPSGPPLHELEDRIRRRRGTRHQRSA